MRLNLPISNTEITLSDTETIVSTTDLHGNITYANQYFIAISGYSADELIGAPQTSCAIQICRSKRLPIFGPSAPGVHGAAWSRTAARMEIITGCLRT